VPKSTLDFPMAPLILLLPVLEVADCAEEAENAAEVVAVAGWSSPVLASAGGESGASIMGESAESWNEEFDSCVLRCAIL